MGPKKAAAVAAKAAPEVSKKLKTKVPPPPVCRKDNAAGSSSAKKGTGKPGTENKKQQGPGPLPSRQPGEVLVCKICEVKSNDEAILLNI